MPDHDDLAALIDAARGGRLPRPEVYRRALALGLTPGAGLALARSAPARPARPIRAAIPFPRRFGRDRDPACPARASA